MLPKQQQQPKTFNMKLLLHVFVLVSGFSWFVAARASQPWNSLDTVAAPAPVADQVTESAASPAGARQIVQRALSKRCLHSYTSACLKLDLVNLVDRLARQESYQVLPSINMVRHDNEEQQQGEGRSAQSDSTDAVMEAVAQDGPEAAETRLDGLLLDRVSRYLDTHAISVRLFDDDTLAKMRKVGQEVADKYGFLSAQTGRGKDKKGGGALLMGLMMMKATLGALGFGAIAALAGKALLVGMLSMMLSAIVGLKSLASGGGGKAVTYEIISKPVYSHAHSHSHEHSEHGGGGYGGGGGYSHGRSFNVEEAAQMAYQGQRQ
ncbi:hypothetical protein B566_EDAN007896 [Ephemera danica]|nr:hypothetical protein B566_EDAN007896 [Ephemera danica]